MIKVFLKHKEDHSLTLVMYNEYYSMSIVFDDYSFTLEDNEKINFQEFDLISTNKNLISLDEIRSDDYLVFYFKMNNEIIFQISHVPSHNDLIQNLYVFDSSMKTIFPHNNKTIYEEAVSRYARAEVYEELTFPFWE